MKPRSAPRVILIHGRAAQRGALARQLRSRGYGVEPFGDPAMGADTALRRPPAAVVADLWIPGISGIQICRLLRSEPATADVPVILRGESDDPKSRFWAKKAGAAYVAVENVEELLGALESATRSRTGNRFMRLGGFPDIRDRIAQHLDAALFESVISAEVRALACEGSFDRLFALLVRLLSQLTSYRWLAAATDSPAHFGLHHHGELGAALSEATQALGIPAEVDTLLVPYDGPPSAAEPCATIACSVKFGNIEIGRIALSVPRAHEGDATTLLRLVARELGGPMRMMGLVEESRLQASTDPLTGLLNRRAFLKLIETELARCERYGYPLSVVMLDVDHFKQVNDHGGHAAGDDVLAQIGAILRGALRKSDFGARWGGEEFVLSLPSTDVAGARVVAERLRYDIESLEIRDARGGTIRVTASVGLASLRDGETFQHVVDRADAAMYAAKSAGRNRVMVADWAAPAERAWPASCDAHVR